MGAPSVVQNPASGRVFVFGRGGGNIVYYQWRNASGPWSGWLRVPRTAAGAGPTAVVHGGQIDLLYPAADGTIKHHMLTGTSSWLGPETLSGRSNRPLSGYLLPNGQLRLWAIGTKQTEFDPAYG